MEQFREQTHTVGQRVEIDERLWGEDRHVRTGVIAAILDEGYRPQKQTSWETGSLIVDLDHGPRVQLLAGQGVRIKPASDAAAPPATPPSE
jgi:hypothetical protein